MLATALSHVEGGTGRALGVAGAARLPMIPERAGPCRGGGVDGVVLTSSFGAIAPAGVPRPIVARMSAVVKVALADPATVKRLEDLSDGAAWSAPDDFRAFAESEIRRRGPNRRAPACRSSRQREAKRKTARGGTPGRRVFYWREAYSFFFAFFAAFFFAAMKDSLSEKRATSARDCDITPLAKKNNALAPLSWDPRYADPAAT